MVATFWSCVMGNLDSLFTHWVACLSLLAIVVLLPDMSRVICAPRSRKWLTTLMWIGAGVLDVVVASLGPLAIRALAEGGVMVCGMCCRWVLCCVGEAVWVGGWYGWNGVCVCECGCVWLCVWGGVSV